MTKVLYSLATRMSCGAASLLAFASLAHADPLARCGQEPDVPSIAATDTAHYNASVDRFGVYEKAARAYNTCVSNHASQEETAISEDARTRIAKVHAVSVDVQQRIAGNFSRLSAQLTAAGRKLSHH